MMQGRQRMPAWHFLLGVAVFLGVPGLGLRDASLAPDTLPAWMITLTLLAEIACRLAGVRLFDMHGNRQRLRQFAPEIQQALLRWGSDDLSWERS